MRKRPLSTVFLEKRNKNLKWKRSMGTSTKPHKFRRHDVDDVAAASSQQPHAAQSSSGGNRSSSEINSIHINNNRDKFKETWSVAQNPVYKYMLCIEINVKEAQKNICNQTSHSCTGYLVQTHTHSAHTTCDAKEWSEKKRTAATRWEESGEEKKRNKRRSNK